MRRTNVEPIRKAALVNAAISEIAQAGTLDVTVGQIARRAGMSAALAHHYFGSKEALFLAAMRHVLTVYGAEVRGALALARGPRERLDAILHASFSATNFRRDVVGAWLNFYVLAQTVPEAPQSAHSLFSDRLRRCWISARWCFSCAKMSDNSYTVPSLDLQVVLIAVLLLVVLAGAGDAVVSSFVMVG